MAPVEVRAAMRLQQLHSLPGLYQVNPAFQVPCLSTPATVVHNKLLFSLYFSFANFYLLSTNMKVLVPPIKLQDPSEIFRPEKVKTESGWQFREYSSSSFDERQKTVFNTYLNMHTYQTVDFVENQRKEWTQFNKFKCGILEALDKLNAFVDDSDPDIALPNSVHGYQTAERIRVHHPDKDWMQLMGLIHDLGKVMAMYGEPQWAVVGDTFPVGCAPAPSVVLMDSTFAKNKDISDPRYNTKLGMYKEGCGLDQVTMSWGHDEYLYRVLINSNCSLPQVALDTIRYHSFYPWHTGGDYDYLCNQKDRDTLPWIQEFNKFDLYTKKEDVPDMDVLRPYYQSLVDKYCPGDIAF
ncbi:Inositol oxygenase [Trinorchestia longiramus]|nr:Inositol oxygenase [Trinorchestia longiramus]